MKKEDKVEEISNQTEFIISFLLREFQKKDFQFRRGVPDLLTHKVLVNFKHDWDRETGKRAPLHWKPYIYGLMPGLQMSDGWRDLIDLAKESPTFKIVTKKHGGEERLLFAPTNEFNEANQTKIAKLFSGSEISVMRILAEIYYRIYKETGRTKELTTLSSCRNEELTYLCCYSELDLWRAATGNLIHLISANLNLLEKNPDPIILERNIKRMALLHTQLEEKIRLFREINSTRQRLEKIFTNYEHKELALSIMSTLKSGSATARLRKMEEASGIMKRYTSFVRYSLFMMNLAKDERPRERKLDEQGKPKDLVWYLNKLQQAFGEARKSIDPEKIIGAVEEKNLEEYLKHISAIYEQFKKWAHRWIRESELNAIHEIYDLDGHEYNSELRSDLNDLKRTVGIRRKISVPAPVLVGDILLFGDLELEERSGALGILNETLNELLPDYNVVDKKGVPVGADGFSVIFNEIASPIEALILAMKIQHNLARKSVGFQLKLSIGIDQGEIETHGAKPIDNYSFNAYYMTRDRFSLEGDIVGPSKVSVTSRIFITERIYAELNPELKGLCVQIGKLRDLYQRIGHEETFDKMVRSDPKFRKKDVVFMVKWENWELEN